jgi:hypothetical protein
MAERRALAEGLKPRPSPVDPAKETEFVFGTKKEATSAKTEASASPTAQSPASIQTRVPISTRMRADFAAALKRASLERQLASVEPNTLQDILEQAVEPWLRSNGYLK